MSKYFERNDNRCAGGVRIDAGPCSKCGAMPNEGCRYPLPDPEITALRARVAELEEERDRLRDIARQALAGKEVE